MKKLLLATTFIALGASAASAAPQGRDYPYWYVGLGAGYSSQSDTKVAGAKTKYDENGSYFASLGYRLGEGLRTEVEAAKRLNDAQTSGRNIDVTTYAINGFYDFDRTSLVTPYVGGGLGFGHFDFDLAGANGSDSQMIYQFMAGLSFEPQNIPRTQWTLGYRYVAPFSDPEVNSVKVKGYRNQSLEAGVKLNF